MDVIIPKALPGLCGTIPAKPTSFTFDGEVFSPNNLPPTYEENRELRWTISRKMIVGGLVHNSLVTEQEVLEKYQMLKSELDFWTTMVNEGNLASLRTTYSQNDELARSWSYNECKEVKEQNYHFADIVFTSEVSAYGSGNFRHIISVKEPTTLHFTELEADLLRLFLHFKNKVIPKEMLYFHRKSHTRGSPPEQKIIDVAVCKARNKLRLIGLKDKLVTVWGRGYMLLED